MGIDTCFVYYKVQTDVSRASESKRALRLCGYNKSIAHFRVAPVKSFGLVTIVDEIRRPNSRCTRVLRMFNAQFPLNRRESVSNALMSDAVVCKRK